MISIKKITPIILQGAIVASMLFIVAYLLTLLLSYLQIIELEWTNVKSSDFGRLVLIIFISKIYLLSILILSLKLFYTIKESVPFQSSTIRRFVVLGVLILFNPIMHILTWVLASVANVNILNHSQIIGMDSFFNKIALFIVTGLLIFAFVHVLKQGLSIYEEQKLTV